MEDRLIAAAAVILLFIVIFFLSRKRRSRQVDQAVFELQIELEDGHLSQPPQTRSPRPRTGASLARSARQRQEWVADRTGQPPTDPMVAAVTRLGFDPKGMDFETASKLLSIRDYVVALVERTPDQETSRQIRALIEELFKDASVHQAIREWSWHTRDHEVRRVPRDELRRRCERFLKRSRK